MVDIRRCYSARCGIDSSFVVFKFEERSRGLAASFESLRRPSRCTLRGYRCTTVSVIAHSGWSTLCGTELNKPQPG
jgi:hypothetical protein